MNWKFWNWKLKKDKTTGTISIITTGYIFPCRDCLILPAGCHQLCNKVEMNENKLREDSRKANKGKNQLLCPDCGGDQWYEGPCGGMSENLKCGKCGHWFNFAGPLGITERIHVSESGRVTN